MTTNSEASRVKRELLLRSLFPAMPAAVHVRFIELLEDLELATGELAFAQGDPPDRFLFLTEGRVALESEGLQSIEFAGFAVVGTGGADKAQIQHMIGIMLSLAGKLQADAADALAVAVTHAHVRATANRIGVDVRRAWRK